MPETAKVFEDREPPGDWHVEWLDDDGGCEIAIFIRPRTRGSGQSDRPIGSAAILRRSAFRLTHKVRLLHNSECLGRFERRQNAGQSARCINLRLRRGSAHQSRPYRFDGCRIWSRSAALANRAPAFRRRIAGPSLPGRAQLGAGNPCTKRSIGRGRRQHCRASSAGPAQISSWIGRLIPRGIFKCAIAYSAQRVSPIDPTQTIKFQKRAPRSVNAIGPLSINRCS
jgi:hypothetical protein